MKGYFRYTLFATLALFINLALLSTTYTMDQRHCREQIPHELLREMYDFYKDLHNKASVETLAPKIAHQIIKKDEERNFLAEAKDYQMSMADIEMCQFWRCHSLALVYRCLAENSKDGPTDSMQFCNTSISFIGNYISFCGGWTSQLQRTAINMIIHRLEMYELLANNHYLIFTLQPQNHVVQTHAPESIAAYKMAAEYCEELTSVNLAFNKILNEGRLNRIRFNLMSSYLTLARVVSFKEAKFYETEAIQLQKLLQHDRDLKLKVKQSINTYEKSKQAIRLEQASNNNNSRLGPQVRNRLALKADKLNTEVKNDIHNIRQNMGIKSPLSSKIIDLYGEINNLDQTDRIKFLKSVADVLKRMESEIAISLKLDITQEDYLKSIYLNIGTFLGSSAIYTMLPTYCLSFIHVDDIEGAIARLSVLQDIQIKQSKTPSFITRRHLAYLKCLLGDFKDWLALEEELKNLKEAKQERREANREAQIQVIKEDVAQKQEEAKKKKEAKTLERSRENKSQQRVHHIPTINSNTQPQLNNNSDVNFDISLKTHQEEKKDQLERHRLAVEARENNKAVKDAERSSSSILPKSHQISVKEEPNEIPSKFSLTDLYHLTSTAADVEEQILNNTWDITRPQLQTYFEDMNCVYIYGNGGSHKKIQMPKSIRVENNGEILMIMLENGEGGGALTLPPWEKGYIPHYLKQQVLRAREKLYAIKIKANKEEAARRHNNSNSNASVFKEELL